MGEVRTPADSGCRGSLPSPRPAQNNYLKHYCFVNFVFVRSTVDKNLIFLKNPVFTTRQNKIDKALSVDRKVSGGVQKLHFCMGQPRDAAVQKYNFCTPGQP